MWSVHRDVQLCWEQFLILCLPGHISNITTSTNRKSEYGRFTILGGKSQGCTQVQWLAKPGKEEPLVDIGLPGSWATVIFALHHNDISEHLYSISDCCAECKRNYKQTKAGKKLRPEVLQPLNRQRQMMMVEQLSHAAKLRYSTSHK